MCLVSARLLFRVPIQGSLVLLLFSSMLYLFVTLGIGLLISARTRNQFLASQVAILSSFLPALMLSGFLFDLRNVPTFIRLVGSILPATYFMELVKTLFLAGDNWHLALKNLLILAGYAVFLLNAARLCTRRSWTDAMANLISVVRGLLYLCRKEFLAIVKDPANRVILIAPAIVQTLLFGYGATYDLNYVPYAVLDQSNGTASRELLARFDSTGVFQRVETLRQVEDIARVIDGGDALLVLHMGPDFEERLARSEAATCN